MKIEKIPLKGRRHVKRDNTRRRSASPSRYFSISMPELNTINNVEINLYFAFLQYVQIITFFGGQVYTNEATASEASRLSFAGEYLGGDASLLISDLLLTDSGEYSCKVKTGGKYHWSQVNLIVLGECCQTHCNTHTHTEADCIFSIGL